MNIKISLAGDLGSGKSTVGKILAEEYGAQLYSTGTIQRKIATEMGMTTLQLNQYMETHPEIDGKIDDGLRALEKEPLDLIIDSRMAWHFVPSSFSVYMMADAYISAERIMNAGRESEPFASVEEAVRSVSDRRKSEMLRYSHLYGVNIKDMENMMNDACNLVNDGNGQMKEMIVSMEDISDRSQQIKKIISIINDITSQTTLLALNASIEAARAGEAGRGFAVVADEVTELARKSSDAADEISRLIEDTMEAVSIGSNKAKKTAAMLEDIATQSHDISQRMTEIAQITNEESASLDQIVSSVNDISSVIQSNSATSQESAASSEELSAQAQVLKDLTRGFQLKGFQ